MSNPNSPRYGHYLTSEEFESKYSPTTEDLGRVRSYLESEGFSVTYVPRNRLFLSARATAANVERVFSTHLDQYEAQKGELQRAPIEPARMPAAIASRVPGGVISLATSRLLMAGLVGLGKPNPATFVAVPVLLLIVTLTAWGVFWGTLKRTDWVTQSQVPQLKGQHVNKRSMTRAEERGKNEPREREFTKEL